MEKEIKDKVDEAKLEVGSREYPSPSWLGWIVAYVPELIATVEASFIAIDAAKLFMEKAEKERDEPTN